MKSLVVLVNQEKYSENLRLGNLMTLIDLLLNITIRNKKGYPICHEVRMKTLEAAHELKIPVSNLKQVGLV